jgi:short-subunit dehydrogenase
MTDRPTILVTGASSGLGFAFAQEFAQKNYNIIMVSVDPDRLSASRNEIAKITEGSVHAIAMNLAKASAGEELFLKLQKEKITIDILINNAGFGTTGPLLKANLYEQMDQITLNSITPTTLSMLFAKDMVRRGSGKILNVASMAAFAPGPFMSVYYATKSYLLRFSVALSYELKNSGVVISTFCPGPVSTNFATRARATKTRLFSRRLPSASEVVKVAIDGLEHDKHVIFDTRKNAIMAFLLKLLPLKTTLKMTARLDQ